MIKRVVFAFDEASQTLIDSLDCEIVELVDGRRLFLASSPLTWNACPMTGNLAAKMFMPMKFMRMKAVGEVV